MCKCESMCSGERSIVPAEDVSAWCSRTGQDFARFATSLDPETHYKTIVVDYLISNPDRHGQNWGFYMDNRSGDLVSLHPLFDHNNAFHPEDMRLANGGQSLMVEGKSKRDAAKFALKRCELKILKPLKREDFLDERHRKSFLERCKTLGIQVRKLGRCVPESDPNP